MRRFVPIVDLLLEDFHLMALVAGFGPAWMWHVGRVHFEQLAGAW